MGEPPFYETMLITTRIELVFVYVGSKLGATVGVAGGSATMAFTILLLVLPMMLVAIT